MNFLITLCFVAMAKTKDDVSGAGNLQGTKRSFRSSTVLFTLVLFLTVSEATKAASIVIDPGAVGSVTSFWDSFFTGLNGTVLNGQSQSLDFYFSDHKFEVTPSLGVNIDINQSGVIGTWPTGWFSVTGYLLDASGNPVSPTRSFPNMGEMPAQIWPGWPFYLADGTQYLPATTMYEGQFGGTPINITPTGYYLQPIVFSGIHLDITYPDIPTETVIGGRLSFYNFSDLIYNSPSPLPVFYVSIPESASTIQLLCLGLIGAAGVTWKVTNVKGVVGS